MNKISELRILLHREKDLILLIAAAFGIMSIAALGIILTNAKAGDSSYVIFYSMGMASPFIGTLIYLRKKGNLRKDLKTLFKPRFQKSSFYISGISVLSLIGTYVVAHFLNYPVRFELLAPLSSLAVTLLGWIAIIWMEEIAWRGVLLPIFLKYMSPFRASFGVNLVWVLWHLPLLFLLEMNGYQLILFSVQTMGLSILITWAYNLSGSFWSGVWIHGVYNAFSLWLLDLLPGFHPNDLIWIAAISQIIPGIIALVYTRGKLGLLTFQTRPKLLLKN